jgi:hypothetical protein
MNILKYFIAGAGIQTSAIAFGGNPPPTGTTTTEEYDGTSWTPSPSMSTARYYLAGCGITISCFSFWWKY